MQHCTHRYKRTPHMLNRKSQFYIVNIRFSFSRPVPGSRRDVSTCSRCRRGQFWQRSDPPCLHLSARWEGAARPGRLWTLPSPTGVSDSWTSPRQANMATSSCAPVPPTASVRRPAGLCITRPRTGRANQTTSFWWLAISYLYTYVCRHEGTFFACSILNSWSKVGASV